jgi:hypothetical protein
MKTDQELEKILIERCEILGLKKKAFDILDAIFSDNSNDEEEGFWCGFDKTEIKKEFETYNFKIERKYWQSIIRTRIVLFIDDKNKVWRDNLEPIGYFELETDFNGNIEDDWFVIEKEKYIKDIDIIYCFQRMSKKLPAEYLRRNHSQYEFISYISLIGTLFMSKEFEGTGRFVQRAYTYLETKIDLIDKDYLKESETFLKMIKEYLIKNELVSDKLKGQLYENKNCG